MKFLRFVFYLLCLLIPFENTALRSVAGVFTAPGAIILIPVFLLIAVINFKHISSYEKKTIIYFLTFFTYSLFVSLFFSFDYNYTFVLDRGVRFLLLILPPVVVFLVVLRQKEEVTNLGVFLIAFVCLLSLVVNLTLPDIVNKQSFIQFSSALSPHRLRGFTLEASTFGFQIILSLLMLFIVLNIKVFYVIPLLFILASITVSKGTLIALFLSFSFCLAFAVRPKAKPVIFAFVACALPLLFSNAFYAMFASDIENYTSVATRGTMFFTSLIILFKYPFGTGFFGYLPAIYENGFNAISLYQKVFPERMNFNEVMGYFVVGATEGISTKTFFFDWLIFAGLPFLFLFFRFHFQLFRIFSQHRKYNEIICLSFLSISLMTFVPIEGRYIAPFAYAFLFMRSQSYLEFDVNENIVQKSKFKSLRVIW